MRFVVHADVPESIDAYYQELGRARPDGEAARAILHYRPEDLSLRRFSATKNPDAGELCTLLRALADGPRSRTALAEDTGLSPRRVTALLTLFADTAAIRIGLKGVSLRRELDPRKAVTAALERIEERERIDRSRIEMLRAYAEMRRCRRQVLLGYFGQEPNEPCGKCDTCASGPATAPDSPRTEAFAIDEKVRHRAWGKGTVMAIEDDCVTVFFDAEGYKVLSLELVAEHDLLQPI